MITQSFSTLKNRIIEELTSSPHLGPIRDFNHTMIKHLHNHFSLEKKALLDVGSSVHGHSLESAIEHGVSLYEGINLGISSTWQSSQIEFTHPQGKVGRLQQMNAEKLNYPDATFDCLLSISTFEHFAKPDVVLAEMYRVLKPGGFALINFEPVWSSSYGCHLHQYGELSQRIPPWSHLYLSEQQMYHVLSRQPWPHNAPISIEQAIRWIYHENDINRIGLPELKRYFFESPFEIEQVIPLPDRQELSGIANYLAPILSYSEEDLMTRGLTITMWKNKKNASLSYFKKLKRFIKASYKRICKI